jgi:hypothetical protein
MRDGGSYPEQDPEQQSEHPETMVGEPGISGSQPSAPPGSGRHRSQPSQPSTPAGSPGSQPSYPASQPSYPVGPSGPGSYPGGAGSSPAGPGGYSDTMPGLPAASSGHQGGQASYPGGPGSQPGGQASYPGGPSGPRVDYPSAPATYPGGPASYPDGAASQPGSPVGYPGNQGGYPGNQGGYQGAPAGYPGAPAGYPGGQASYPGGAVSQPAQPVDYPGGAPSYPGGPASTFGSPAGPPPQAPPPSGKGGHGGRRGGGSRAKWSWSSWWIAPYLVGAVAVVLVFAILQVTVLSSSSGTAVAAAKPLLPAQAFPDTLFTRLTTDIKTQNKKDFLSLTAASAKPAVTTWWDNLAALGWSTGLIMPTNKFDQVNLDGDGNGTTIALAGMHNSLDPLNHDKQADVPLEQYQVGLHFSGIKAIGQITSWQGLGNAPWDQGKLYVRKGARVVVAGPAAESAVVDETLPLAETAAEYDVGLVDNVHNTDIRQTGFVVFVSHNATTRSKWFSTTKQPSGWPPYSTSLTAQLSGPAASADQTWKLPGLAQDVTGGARVVITPWQDENGGNASLETAELVTRFAQDYLSSDNQYQASITGGSTAPVIPAWAIEGFGVAFEAAYESNNNSSPDKYSFSKLNQALKELPASEKTGTVPTAKQLYDSDDATEQDARVVAASVYAAIGTKYGMAQLLGSAGLMWTGPADPRGNVLDASSSTNENFEFFTQSTIQSDWEAYLANPTDLAPPTGPNGI